MGCAELVLRRLPSGGRLAGRSERISQQGRSERAQAAPGSSGAACTPALEQPRVAGRPGSAARLGIAACVTLPRRGEGGRASWAEARCGSALLQTADNQREPGGCARIVRDEKNPGGCVGKDCITVECLLLFSTCMGGGVSGERVCIETITQATTELYF